MPTNRDKRQRIRKNDLTKEIPDDLLFYLRHGYDRANPYCPPISELYGEVCFFMFHKEKLAWLLEAWARHEKLIRETVKGKPYILELIEYEKNETQRGK